MKQLATERLIVRRISMDDAAFILQLLNEPGWLRFIGDRGVRSLDDARAYIQSGPLETYSRLGIGFGVVTLKAAGAPMGICGLTKRDYLDAPDLGFAFLPEHWGKGYAREAAAAVLTHGREQLKLRRVLATTRVDNFASQRVLECLGFRFERTVVRPDTGRELNLYAVGAPASEA